MVTAVARQTSDECGRLRVERFRGSASDVDLILDRDVTPEGATASNRDRNRDDLLAEVRQTVEQGMAAAPAQGGSDPVGAMGRGARLLGQEERDHKQLIMVTDGVQSSEPNLATDALTAATAKSFVDQAGTLPDLTGIDLVVTGVGRVSGAQPPSSYINGLVAFYEEVCTRSGAASCQVVDALLLPGAAVRELPVVGLPVPVHQPERRRRGHGSRSIGWAGRRVPPTATTRASLADLVEREPSEQEQIEALEREQLEALERERLEQLSGSRRSGTQIEALEQLEREQIEALEREQLEALEQEQIGTLERERARAGGKDRVVGAVRARAARAARARSGSGSSNELETPAEHPAPRHRAGPNRRPSNARGRERARPGRLRPRSRRRRATRRSTPRPGPPRSWLLRANARPSTRRPGAVSPRHRQLNGVS